MIQDITSQLYADAPQERLYHYTSFNGLLGIVESRALWATDIRYMNDSAELKHTGDLIRTEVTRRIGAGHARPDLLNQFLDWVTHRITNGHMLFAASFRANGNLLSQWRGYSRLGKGVSLGFDPGYILGCAREQSFQIGRCIYSCEQQARLINQVVDAVETLAAEHEPGEGTGEGSGSDSVYHTVFEKIESDLLRIAAILKHPSFREEEEWRVVSPVITNYVGGPGEISRGRVHAGALHPVPPQCRGQRPHNPPAPFSRANPQQDHLHELAHHVPGEKRHQAGTWHLLLPDPLPREMTVPQSARPCF